MLHAFMAVVMAGCLPSAETVLPTRTNPGVEVTKKESFIVGQFLITGNGQCTSYIFDDLIKDLLRLYAGQTRTRSDLRAAEMRLAPLILLGVSTRVTLVDFDCDDCATEVRDILVDIQETPNFQFVSWMYYVAPSLLEAVKSRLSHTEGEEMRGRARLKSSDRHSNP